MNSTPPKSSTQPVAAVERDEQESYARHVNPEWIKLVKLLQMNLHYTRCRGAELETAEGRTILDFHSSTQKVFLHLSLKPPAV